MFTSQQLNENNIYTRQDLIDKFGIIDKTINTGIFKPAGHDSVWLFVTQQKTPNMTQYTDYLKGDILYWDGQTAGLKDKLIIEHEKRGLELVVFFRQNVKQYPGAGFKFLGRYCYITHSGSNPAHFQLKYLDVEM